MLEGLIPRSHIKEMDLVDGTKMSYREWKGGKASDVIIYLHGLESHAGWFIETGDQLNHNSLNIYGLDRRGSGLNRVDRGHMTSYRVLVNDVKEFIGFVRTEHPESRIYLMGLCWGAKLAVMFSAQYGDCLDGLILVTPAIKSKADLTFGQKLDVAYSSFFRPRKLFDVPLDECTFTDNKRYLKFMERDELKLKKASARFFFETGKMNSSFDGIAKKIKLPTLVLLSECDTIIDNEGTKRWFDRIASDDKAIRLYKDCRHGLLFEEPKEPINCIVKWMKKRKNKKK